MIYRTFETMHGHLQDSYSDASGLFTDLCTRVAYTIADELRANGQVPDIVIIRGQVIDETGNRKPIVPSPFDGEITWAAHVVCVVDEIVYDPMIQIPLPLDEYLATAFYGQNVELEIDLQK